MKKVLNSIVLLVALLATFLINGNGYAQDNSKTRLIILADMGNEPDEEQQMFHMLMYSNEFDLEGLIAVTGKFLNPSVSIPERRILHPELFTKLINGYAKVYTNLKKHAEGYPEPKYLHSIVRAGQKDYGYQVIGEGKSSPGSELIVEAIKKEDPRPIYVVVNAGSNTLAQALFDLDSLHSDEEMSKFISKLRVFENGAQDNAGAYICNKYPDINWIRSNYQTYCYGGPGHDGAADGKGDMGNIGPHTWQPYEHSAVGQHFWLLKNVMGNHGSFGTHYPIRQFPIGKIASMEGGGTVPWLGLITKGLYSIDNPHWGSWSGRYTKEKVKNEFSKHASVNIDEEKFTPFYVYTDDVDKWTNPETGNIYNNSYAPVYRWRRAIMNDFKCRMDWCIQDFDNANHNPIAAIDGDASNEIKFIQTEAGTKLVFNANGSSDPDADKLSYSWWVYKEAGNFTGEIELNGTDTDQVEINIPENSKGKDIHLILEVKDDNEIASMYDYRRIVISVSP